LQLGEADFLEKLVLACASDVGRSRSENQDAWREASNALGERLLVLADGMGGHRGGAEASRMCVQTIEQRFLEQHDPVELRLRRGIDEANSDILHRGLEDSDLGGMGATCVALVVCPDGQGWVAWAGDSRLYRLRAGVLEALTEDHSLVAEWQKMGVLTPAQAAAHPKRNELTRAIGVTREVEPELRALELRAGDRYLLCSDGLCGVVDADTIAQLLGAHPPEVAVRALIECANARGGPDNVTVLIAWLPGDEAEEPAAEPPALAPEPDPPTPPVSPEPRPREFELPVRPAPLAPLVPRATARAAAPPQGEMHGRAASPGRSRVWSRALMSFGKLHSASLVAGVLLGVALALCARAYLDWQANGATSPPLRAVPAPSVAAPMPAPPPVVPVPDPAPARPRDPVPARETPEPVPPAPVAGPAPASAAPSTEAPPPPAAAPVLVPVPAPLPTSQQFELPQPVHEFLDAWLAALTRDDAAAYAALGFRSSAAEFQRTEASRESYRLQEVEIGPRSTAEQVHLRVVLSYAFSNGSGRFRTEDELRLLLDATAGGLHFAGYWQE
jgi:protein phosphatase